MVDDPRQKFAAMVRRNEFPEAALGDSGFVWQDAAITMALARLRDIAHKHGVRLDWSTLNVRIAETEPMLSQNPDMGLVPDVALLADALTVVPLSPAPASPS